MNPKTFHLAILIASVLTCACLGSAAETPAKGSLPVGELIHDGPPTPEQICLFLPVTGGLPVTAVATVRYKATSSATWTVGHPLHRIRPSLSENPPAHAVPDAFAWPIIDLTPGTAYEVEVTIADGGVSDVRNASFTTRALPAKTGTPTTKIAAGSAAAAIQGAFNGLTPGDVIQFENGTYDVDDLLLNVGGTVEKPICIRGESRAGVVLSDPSGRILHILTASHVVIENLTLKGSGVDSGTDSSSTGVQFWNDAKPMQSRVTVRNVTMSGVDRAIRANGPVGECLAYDNTFIGNNTWVQPIFDTNASWNDDGVNVPGFGNCVFNNTLEGFGDSLAYTSSDGDMTVGIHYYRNEIRNSCDDLVEVDYSFRNVTFYDNRCHNSMTTLSLDPLYGGPLLFARNISINVGRVPFKWNSTNSGQFVYNNTIIRTTGRQFLDGALTSEAGWIQHNNGAQCAYGYQNNILIYLGKGTQTIRLDNSGHDPVDFSHNSWFPDGIFQWPQGRFGNLAEAYKGLQATTPVFSGASKRHELDNITSANPWTTAITLGETYRDAVTDTYLPTLAKDSAPKHSGVEIPGVTDGFSGTAPDRGAVIDGRTPVDYGDQSMKAGNAAKPSSRKPKK